jgi:hypothetical protein
MKTITSRYGNERKVVSNGHNCYTISGKAHYWRVGMNEDNTEIQYFDPEGGPFFAVGSNYGFGVIQSIMVEKHGDKDTFKIIVEVA